MDFQLRTYAFIDSMQPQAAAHVASTCQGDVPIAGMSELFIEVAPGNEIFRCADVALKAADVRPALADRRTRIRSPGNSFAHAMPK